MKYNKADMLTLKILSRKHQNHESYTITYVLCMLSLVWDEFGAFINLLDTRNFKTEQNTIQI